MKSKFAYRVLLIAFMTGGVVFAPKLSNADERMSQIVVINCPGDTIIIDENKDTVTIGERESVRFAINPGSCTNVTISGTGPIGTFVLTAADPDTTIKFDSTGDYTYTATRNVREPGDEGLVQVVERTPLLTQWGILVLLLLLLLSGVYVIYQRRKGVVRA